MGFSENAAKRAARAAAKLSQPRGYGGKSKRAAKNAGGGVFQGAYKSYEAKTAKQPQALAAATNASILPRNSSLAGCRSLGRRSVLGGMSSRPVLLACARG